VVCLLHLLEEFSLIGIACFVQKCNFVDAPILCLRGRVLLNNGGPIEKHANKIYTPNVYNLFEVQIFQSASYTAQEIIRGSRFIVVHFDAEKRERWSRGSFEVQVDAERDFFQCDCGMYEHMGILCSHVIRVSYQSICRKGNNIAL
jgi:hypothetical protein